MATDMTDSMVNDAVRKAMAAYKAALTRANRAHQCAADAAISSFGSTDVEQAARNCAMRRAEIARAQAVDNATNKRRATLAGIRARAGVWADLVPEVSP